MHTHLRTTMVRTTIAGALAVAVALAAGACKKSNAGRSDTATATGTLDTAATTNQTLHVTDVLLGRTMRGDTAVADETDTFRPRDAIHAIVKHEGAATNATITARWTFQDGQVVDERSETVNPTGTRTDYTHFVITKKTAWPVGKYTLHILVNGSEVETKDFQVKATG